MPGTRLGPCQTVAPIWVGGWAGCYRRPRLDVVGYLDGDRLARGVASGVRARDRNRVDAAGTLAEAIGPKLNRERAGDHPVIRRERFIARHRIDATRHRTTARIAHISHSDGEG